MKYSNYYRRVFLIVLLLFFIQRSFVYGQNSQNDSIPSQVLGEVIVIGHLQKKSIELVKATTKHKLIAGGTSIAIMQPKIQRLETLKDALKLEPGVMIQEFFGANDQPRLNIRGSGIQSNPQRRGVYLMQDGIPVNFADGSYVIGVMNPMNAEFVEVFKGANAMQYGTATLGGVINFTSRRGTKKGNFFVKSQTGAFDYYATTVMGGKKWKNIDAHTTINVGIMDKI